MKLLHMDSSITGANSASRQLSAALVAALKAAIPGLEAIRRDLDANPIPHLDSKRLPTVRPANVPDGAVGIADEGGGDVLDEFLGSIHEQEQPYLEAAAHRGRAIRSPMRRRFRRLPLVSRQPAGHRRPVAS